MLLQIYRAENESGSGILVSRTAVLRIITQMMRAKRDTSNKDILLLKPPSETIKFSKETLELLATNVSSTVEDLQLRSASVLITH